MTRLGNWMTLAVAPLLVLIPGSGCDSAPAATPERGEWMFRNYCASCHQEDGTGNPAALSPAIAGLPVWYVERQLNGFRDGFRGADFDDIAGMRMRPMARTLSTDVDITAVAQHIASLPTVTPSASVEGDAEAGEKLYVTCQACHGADGRGNEALGSPPLTNTHDWYLVTQLNNFKNSDRGQIAGDTFGAQMAPMAATLPDDKAIHDVVAHILTLRK